MTVPSPKIMVLAQRLQAGFGTDIGLSDEIEALSLKEAKQLDTIVFECSVCNHWFHQRDNATPDAAEWTCKECK